MIDGSKHGRLELAVIVVILLGAGLWAYINTPQDISPNTVDLPNQETIMTQSEGFRLESRAFDDDGTIPVEYTCDGSNDSPPLSVRGVPAGAKSLAIIMEDADAPDGPFTHWIMWDINPTIEEMPVGAFLAKTTWGKNSAGGVGYAGPCPPAGGVLSESKETHRYFFKLYALDNDIGLDNKAMKEDLMREMNGHIVGEATLVGRYGRK